MLQFRCLLLEHAKTAEFILMGTEVAYTLDLHVDEFIF